MSLLESFIGNAAGAGANILGERAKNEFISQEREKEARLQDELLTRRQKVIEAMREEADIRKEQRTQERAEAPLKRFAAAGREAAGQEVPVDAAPVTMASGQDPMLAANTAGQADPITSGMTGKYADLVAKAKYLPVEDQKPYLDQLKRQFGADQADAINAVAGQTRKRTSDEAVNVALENTKLNDPMAYAAGLPLSRSKTLTVKDGDTILDAGTMKPIYSNAKDKNTPAALQEYEYAQRQGYAGSFNDWATEQKRAGATSLSVNTGQHGFTNALKLREDFKTEPIYKAHQEVQSAYAQIQQGLSKKSPAGDLAGATKIMKLLDPGSVVRESELAMAMAASGALDRLEGYASNVINGTKLNPTQRKDFQEMADRLYLESAKQYNSKQGEYRGIAERNGLSVEDVVGKPANLPKLGGKASSAGGMPADISDLLGKYGGK